MTDRSSTDTHDFFALFERLPFVGTVTKELAHLRALLLERRAPRVLALGAPGSGKTTLVNALLDADVLPALPAHTDDRSGPAEPAPQAEASPSEQVALAVPHGSWARAAARSRQLAWLEIGTVVTESGVSEWPRETQRLLTNALEEHPPDLVVVVLRAARLEEELPSVRASLTRLYERLGERARPPVVVVVTAADELCKPIEFAKPPYPTDAMARIERATLLAKTSLENGAVPSGVEITRGLPCACPADRGARWNLEEVAERMLAKLPDATKVEAVRALPVGDGHVRDVARKIVLHFASIAVVVGLMPIPFSDAIALFPTQALMVTSVAYVAGQPWDRRAALEWLGSLGVMGGTAFGLRWGAQQLLKLWPGGGTLISASVAGVGTEALGLSAIAYFVDGPGRRGRRAAEATSTAAA